jgi:hypothetical protein
MISKSEIETFAVQIGDSDFNTADLKPLIGHLSNPEFHAVLDRGGSRQRTGAPSAGPLETLPVT